MKQCTTHHHACDCREAATARLIADLFDLLREWRSPECAWTDPHARHAELKAEAKRLGYSHLPVDNNHDS